MIKYYDNGTLACFNNFSFRKDMKTGYFLSSQKIGESRKRLHVYVWEFYNGKVPHGYEIHHKDKDKNNNEIENLEMLTSEEHRKIHSVYDVERKEKAKINLIQNAMPKAKEWHSTPEGKKWHSEHAKAVLNNLPEKDYICSYCGNHFTTKKIYNENQNRFCSNKCKSAYRRKSGVDNVEKICEECNKTYIESKYRKTAKCPSCRNKKC